MRIERLEIVPYALHFKQPYVTARGRLERRELALVRLWTDEGLLGLGEAAPLVLRGATRLEAVVSDLERCRPLLEGKMLDPADWTSPANACAAATLLPPAVAAVETALLDIAGKSSGRPAWSVLGASLARPVACNATLVAAEPARVADDALRWAERGFRTFKLKVGVDGDVEQALAVREAVGAGARIRLDANGMWSRGQALATLGALEALAIELVEQPVASLDDMVAVRKRVTIPVAADESVSSPEEARHAVLAGACDLATVKIAKVGGILAGQAVALELPVYLSSALDGPVGIAAAAHLAQVLPDAGLAHGLATAELFDGTIASRESAVVDAALTPSEAPGIGVEIDERALERCRI